MPVSQYRQMCGRAGRKGQTKHGESFLICKYPNQLSAAATLMQGDIPTLVSAFAHRTTQSQAVARLALEAIGTGIVTTTYVNPPMSFGMLSDLQYDRERLNALAKCTLAHVQGTDLLPLLHGAVKELAGGQLIEITQQNSTVCLTRLFLPSNLLLIPQLYLG